MSPDEYSYHPLCMAIGPELSAFFKIVQPLSIEDLENPSWKYFTFPLILWKIHCKSNRISPNPLVNSLHEPPVFVALPGQPVFGGENSEAPAESETAKSESLVHNTQKGVWCFLNISECSKFLKFGNAIYIILYYIILYYIILYYVILYYIILYYIMLYYGILCYIILCYIMLYYVISCYIILFYIILASSFSCAALVQEFDLHFVCL